MSDADVEHNVIIRKLLNSIFN